jgi:hypothetical protein
MGFDLGIFQDAGDGGLEAGGGLDVDYIEWLTDVRSVDVQTHFGKLWEYYTNPMVETLVTPGGERQSGRCYVQAQEYGLPVRITGLVHSANGGVFGAKTVKDVQRKEVVIENDIAWRINAAVDFLFGKPISFISKSPDGQKRVEIESILKAVFAANGAIGFFQDMAVLGSVYGFVDCFVRPGDEIIARTSGYASAGKRTSSSSQTLPLSSRFAGALEEVLQLAQTIVLELIEAPRALPVLEENDYKKIRYYVQHFYQKKNALSKKSSFFARLLSPSRRSSDSREVVAVTEITSATAWQRYENRQLVAESKLPWGFLPVVHIQNIAQPYYYEGLGDVEPLISLQDELNTRLSDRASRITFQSFKM